MLLNDESARQKAQELINNAGMNADVFDPQWIYMREDGDSPEDIYAFHIKEGEVIYLPGYKIPLFKRNGEESPFRLGLYA